MRIRRLTVVIAVLALALGVWTLARRLAQQSSVYRTQAVMHRKLEAIDAQIEALCHERLADSTPCLELIHGDELRSLAREAASSRQHEAMLAARYLRAASRPWITVRDDRPATKTGSTDPDSGLEQRRARGTGSAGLTSTDSEKPAVPVPEPKAYWQAQERHRPQVVALALADEFPGGRNVARAGGDF
jgi:hypothetical protein